jgi:hypothetical protein
MARNVVPGPPRLRDHLEIELGAFLAAEPSGRHRMAIERADDPPETLPPYCAHWIAPRSTVSGFKGDVRGKWLGDLPSAQVSKRMLTSAAMRLPPGHTFRHFLASCLS